MPCLVCQRNMRTIESRNIRSMTNTSQTSSSHQAVVNAFLPRVFHTAAISSMSSFRSVQVGQPLTANGTFALCPVSPVSHVSHDEFSGSLTLSSRDSKLQQALISALRLDSSSQPHPRTGRKNRLVKRTHILIAVSSALPMQL